MAVNHPDIELHERSLEALGGKPRMLPKAIREAVHATQMGYIPPPGRIDLPVGQGLAPEPDQHVKAFHGLGAVEEA